MNDSRPARAALVAVVLLGFLSGVFELFDADLARACAAGRHVLGNRAVPHENFFSGVDPHAPWVDDQWLFDVVAAKAVGALPPAVLVLLRALAVAALAFVLARPPRGEERTPERRVLSALLGVVALFAASPAFALRPELVSLFFVAAFARTLAATAPLGAKDLVALTMLQAFWANLNGDFVFGPLLALATLVGRAIDSALTREVVRDGSVRFFLVPLLVAASLLNPYGVDLLIAPLSTLRALVANSASLSSILPGLVPPFSSVIGSPVPTDVLAYRVLLGAGAAALAVGALRLRVRLQQLLPLALVVGASLVARQWIPLVAAVLPPIAARWLSPGRSHFVLVGSAASACVLGALALAVLVVTGRVAVHDRSTRTFSWTATGMARPDAEVEFVRRELPPGVAFASIAFGGDFARGDGASQRAFVDENVAGVPIERLVETADFVTGRVPKDGFIAKHALSRFVLDPAEPLAAALLADERYVPVFLGRHAVVIVARTSEHEGVIRRFDLRAALKAGALEPAARTETRGLFVAYAAAERNRARVLASLGRADLAEHALAEAESIESGRR